eukprot:scaffold5533_cov159-Amphora_coffeaeformis.AAC.14
MTCVDILTVDASFGSFARHALARTPFQDFLRQVFPRKKMIMAFSASPKLVLRFLFLLPNESWETGQVGSRGETDGWQTKHRETHKT